MASSFFHCTSRTLEQFPPFLRFPRIPQAAVHHTPPETSLPVAVGAPQSQLIRWTILAPYSLPLPDHSLPDESPSPFPQFPLVFKTLDILSRSPRKSRTVQTQPTQHEISPLRATLKRTEQTLPSGHNLTDLHPHSKKQTNPTILHCHDQLTTGARFRNLANNGCPEKRSPCFLQ